MAPNSPSRAVALAFTWAAPPENPGVREAAGLATLLAAAVEASVLTKATALLVSGTVRDVDCGVAAAGNAALNDDIADSKSLRDQANKPKLSDVSSGVVGRMPERHAPVGS